MIQDNETVSIDMDAQGVTGEFEVFFSAEWEYPEPWSGLTESWWEIDVTEVYTRKAFLSSAYRDYVDREEMCILHILPDHIVDELKKEIEAKLIQKDKQSELDVDVDVDA